VSPIPEEAKDMMDDRAFMQAILASPEDDAPRLVYADWLEERGESQRGEFLRADVTLAKLSKGDGGYAKVRTRWRALRAQIDPNWLVLVARQPIENCSLRFEFECPRKWEKLRTTEDDAVRFCDACEQNVYYCRDIRDAQRHAWQGHCVAVDAGVTRSRGDLDPPVQMMLGMIARPENLENSAGPDMDENVPQTRDERLDRQRPRRTLGKIRPLRNRGRDSSSQE
jgi:uncharacterized protein (TIGR02996 family)